MANLGAQLDKEGLALAEDSFSTAERAPLAPLFLISPGLTLPVHVRTQLGLPVAAIAAAVVEQYIQKQQQHRQQQLPVPATKKIQLASSLCNLNGVHALSDGGGEQARMQRG